MCIKTIDYMEHVLSTSQLLLNYSSLYLSGAVVEIRCIFWAQLQRIFRNWIVVSLEPDKIFEFFVSSAKKICVKWEGKYNRIVRKISEAF